MASGAEQVRKRGGGGGGVKAQVNECCCKDKKGEERIRRDSKEMREKRLEDTKE